MTISPLSGKPAPEELLIHLARLEREYFSRQPDLDDPGAADLLRDGRGVLRT